jgi:hypothetical protein
MLVSTTVLSTRSLRPRVTFRVRAKANPRSLTSCRVLGPRLGPPDQCRVIWHGLPIHPAKLAQDQAIAHEALGVLIPPPVYPLEDPQPQDDLHRGRIPPRVAVWGYRRSKSALSRPTSTSSSNQRSSSWSCGSRLSFRCGTNANRSLDS